MYLWYDIVLKIYLQLKDTPMQLLLLALTLGVSSTNTIDHDSNEAEVATSRNTTTIDGLY